MNDIDSDKTSINDLEYKLSESQTNASKLEIKLKRLQNDIHDKDDEYEEL